MSFGYQAAGRRTVPCGPPTAPALGQWRDYSEEQQIIGQAARKSEPTLIWQRGRPRRLWEAVLARADTDPHQPVEPIQPVQSHPACPCRPVEKPEENQCFLHSSPISQYVQWPTFIHKIKCRCKFSPQFKSLLLIGFSTLSCETL